MQDSRNNIMFRKQKAYNGRNNTSAEATYIKEQSRIETLKNKREELSEHRRVTLHGSSEEKAQLKSKINQDVQLQLYIKDQKIREEQEKNLKENQEIERHRKALIEMERQREVEKKERLRQAQELNRIVAISKKSQNLETKLLEDMRDREAIRDNINRYQPNVL